MIFIHYNIQCKEVYRQTPFVVCCLLFFVQYAYSKVKEDDVKCKDEGEGEDEVEVEDEGDGVVIP